MNESMLAELTGFFVTNRPGYRPEQAVDGWRRVFDFLHRHLSEGSHV